MQHNSNQSLPAKGAPGFALVAVLFLAVLITVMIPVMLNLSRESVNAVQQEQARALASEYARQIFMMTHAQLLTNSGLPQGWVQGNDTALASTSALEDLANCSGYLNLNEDWNRQDARISWMEINDNQTTLNGAKIIAGIYRDGYGALPYQHYIVLACVITPAPLSQGAVMRGEFAISSQRIYMIALKTETT